MSGRIRTELITWALLCLVLQYVSPTVTIGLLWFLTAVFLFTWFLTAVFLFTLSSATNLYMMYREREESKEEST